MTNNIKKFTFEYRLPNNKDNFSLVKNCLGSLIHKVCCISKPNCSENNCHNNVNLYISMYGGFKISGFYLVKNIPDDIIVAIRHSVWENTYGDIIDITKFSDNRPHNIFVRTDDFKNISAIEFNGDNIIYH